jgi:protein phosphatase
MGAKRTVLQSRDINFDVASVLGVGRRDYQEDALATDFPIGAGFGYAVLADGMGGHAAGDVASKIVVTEVFSELKLQSGNPDIFLQRGPEILNDAALAANGCVKAHTDNNPDASGMGSTLVATVFFQDRMNWISVGDSPLFLFRDGELSQLNEDHSLAPQIDFMVRTGKMDPEVGRNHPDRNCLTSVLIGGEIERIDCPEEPYQLRDGDTLVLASDGLQFLSDEKIQEVLVATQDENAATAAQVLLDTLNQLDDPDQDNVSFTIIRCSYGSEKASRFRVVWDNDDSETEIGLAANTLPDANEQPLSFRHSENRG